MGRESTQAQLALNETFANLTMTGGFFSSGAGAIGYNVTGATSITGGFDNTIFLGNSGVQFATNSLSLTDMTATAGPERCHEQQFHHLREQHDCSQPAFGWSRRIAAQRQCAQFASWGSRCHGEQAGAGWRCSDGWRFPFADQSGRGRRHEWRSVCGPQQHGGQRRPKLQRSRKWRGPFSERAAGQWCRNDGIDHEDLDLAFSRLPQVNTYNGATNVKAGTLIVSGSASGSNAIVGNSAIPSAAAKLMGGDGSVSAIPTFNDISGVTFRGDD
jgi:hypothetical protein